MRFVWLTALKDLARRRHDPIALLGWIATPVVITLLLSVVFRGGGATPQGKLMVADEDSTLASRFLLGAFSQGKLSEMFVVEKVEREAGRERIRKGDASALLVIPKGFGSALLRSEPTRLSLLTNPAQRILPGIIEETLSIFADGAFYAQLIAGDQLRAIATGPAKGAKTFPDLVIALFSVKVNQLVSRLQTYLNPPLIKLETSVTEEGPSISFADAFFPAMLFMALLFMAQGLSGDLWREHLLGTLRRAATAPQRFELFLAGKALAVALLIATVGLIGLVSARALMGIKVANLPAALGWATFAGTALYLLMALVQLHASNARAGNVLTSVVLYPMAMLGGSFFPFELMPANLAAIGRWTPNGWAVVQFKAILAGALVPGRLAASFAGLLAVGVLAFLLGMRRLRRAF